MSLEPRTGRARETFNWLERADPMTPGTLLTRVWIGFSTVGTVVSLASLFDDVIAWGRFIREMIAAYRGLVEPLWSFVLGWLPLRVPDWAHDYLTLNSLMSVAIFWALHQTRETLQTGPGTPLIALWSTELEFRVGGNSFERIEAAARRAAEARDEVSPALEAAIAQAGRAETGPRLVVDGLLAALVLAAAFVFAPVLAPGFMAYRDRLANRRARRAFARRAAEVRASGLPPEETALLLDAIEARAADYASIEGLNDIYHAEIRRQILLYYLAVAVGFLGIVLVNYVALRIGRETEAT